MTLLLQFPPALSVCNASIVRLTVVGMLHQLRLVVLTRSSCYILLQLGICSSNCVIAAPQGDSRCLKQFRCLPARADKIERYLAYACPRCPPVVPSSGFVFDYFAPSRCGRGVSLAAQLSDVAAYEVNYFSTFTLAFHFFEC